MRTRDLLWAEMESVYAAILEHPFIAGLTDGSLPRSAFRHYVVQDAHYLRGYARALAVCAAKAPDEDATLMFAGHAGHAIAAERELHASLLAELGATSADPVGPTTQAYTSYLFQGVYSGSFGEAVATVLPCYWIYARVGEQLLARSSPEPLYARWIATYGAEEFQKTVDDVLAVTDRIDAGAGELARMRAHVRTTARYEWMFWDAGYREEQWPIQVGPV